MLINSLLIALLALAVAGGAWSIDHFGRAWGHHSDRAYRIGAVVFFSVGMALTLLLAWLQYEYIRSTVFEQTVDGSEDMAPGATVMRSVQFTLDNTHEHRLDILPQRAFGTDAHAPARLTVTLTGPRGDTLFSENVTVDLNEITTVSDGRSYTSYEWKTWSTSFTPPEPGRHWLEINIHTTDIPEIHIRVANPQKGVGDK